MSDTLKSVARVTVIGDVSAPGDVRYTGSGKALTTFRVRVDEAYRGRDGGQQVRSSEVPVTWWGDHELAVGAMVFIEGRLSGRSYESRGEERWALELVADKVVRLDRNARNGDAAGTPPARPRDPGLASPPPDDQDVPF